MNIQTLFNVAETTVLITGSSKGIGLDIARGFIENGSKVILHGRNQKVLEQLTHNIGALDYV